MKTKIFAALLMLTGIMATSCTEDMEYKDTDVTAVKQLYSPKADGNVQLLSSATATEFFEWSSALAEDGGAPLYEVVFDKKDGDFTNPIYRVVSDNMGSRAYATISHKTLDKIAALAGLGSGETGTVKWTVCSSRGIKQKMAEESRNLNITRLLGFAELPAQVFITGEGTEAGTDITKAIACSSPESGEFEIFTRLEAGKKYHFVSERSATARVFYLDGTAIKESSDGNGSATVDETAIYRINLDFNIASVTMSKVVSVGWFFSPDNKVDFYLDYQGNGIWMGHGETPFHQESWGRDERYKFEMKLDKGGDITTVHWGPTNASLDSRPGDNEDPSYYYMKEWTPSQWDNKWKLHGKFDGTDTKFTFYLNADGPYHHTVELYQ